jgi:ribosome-binding protein aMBF1 (putative translation factor)
MNVVLHQRFTAKLRQALDDRGWSQSELARRLNIDQSVVNRYLNGRICPGLDLVEKFASALGVEPHNLLDDRPLLLLELVEG